MYRAWYALKIAVEVGDAQKREEGVDARVPLATGPT